MNDTVHPPKLGMWLANRYWRIYAVYPLIVAKWWRRLVNAAKNERRAEELEISNKSMRKKIEVLRWNNHCLEQDFAEATKGLKCNSLVEGKIYEVSVEPIPTLRHMRIKLSPVHRNWDLATLWDRDDIPRFLAEHTAREIIKHLEKTLYREIAEQLEISEQRIREVPKHVFK